MRRQFYATDVRGNLAKAFELTNTQVLRSAALPKSYTDLLGRKMFRLLLTVQGLGAFALITLGVIQKKSGVAKNVIRPRIRQEIARAGVALMPMFMFVAFALGFLVIGQTVSALARVGAATRTRERRAHREATVDLNVRRWTSSVAENSEPICGMSSNGWPYRRSSQHERAGSPWSCDPRHLGVFG